MRSIGIGSVALAALIGWTVPGQRCQAAEYYVDAAGIGGPANDAGPGSADHPWKTLARAFSDKTPTPGAGDTVFVRDGIYHEAVVIERGGAEGKPLTLTAYPGDAPTLDGETKLETAISLPGNQWNYVTEELVPAKGSADYVTINGLRIINYTKTGIYASGRKSTVIQNTQVASITGTGVWFAACTGPRLLKCHVHHCDTTVNVQAPCFDVMVADCEIDHSKRDGMDCWGPADCVVAASGTAALTLQKIEPAGAGLAKFTLAAATARGRTVDLSKANAPMGGRLPGQDANGSVKCPIKIFLFLGPMTRSDDQDAMELVPGGPIQLNGWTGFVLRNNPEWGDKPYSPDGQQALFETANATMEDLAKAKSVFLFQTFKHELRTNSDIRILRNHIHDVGRQGVLIPCVDCVLLQGNVIHTCGATGVQAETGARHLWFDGNICYGNNLVNAGETCLWVDEDKDVMMQNNIVHASQIGIAATHSQQVILRRNVVYSNRAQNDFNTVQGSHDAAAGIRLDGGVLTHLGATATVDQCAIVHNTLYDNGNETSPYATGIVYGGPGYPVIRKGVILNNLIQRTHGRSAMTFYRATPLISDGNIFSGSSRSANICVMPHESKNWPKDSVLYPIGEAAAFDAYRKATGFDLHSLYAEVKFADADAADFHPLADSPAIDAGVPLTTTTAAGEGETLAVVNAWAFSAGFKNTKGEQWIPGDEIVVAGATARVTAVDYDKNLLTLDRKIAWQAGAPVGYTYLGKAPDVGAFEVK